MGLDIFENEGISEKECDWGTLYTLDFKKIPFILYIYILAKILQIGAKFRYAKAGFKNYRNLNNFRQAMESPKS